MASGIINYFLQDSIVRLEEESSAILNELAELHIHDTTPVLLPIATSEGTSTPSPENAIVEESLKKLETVQAGFSEISSIVLQLQSNTGPKSTSAQLNSKLISLKKINKVLKPFSEGSIVQSVTKDLAASDVSSLSLEELEIVTKLEDLVAKYALLALYQICLSDLLTATLPLGDDFLYWTVAGSSSWRVMLYTLQTIPSRTTGLAESVWRDLKTAAAPNVNSLDITVPSYITSTFPTYQNTYKLFAYYKRLIVNSLYNNIISSNIKGFYKFIGASTTSHKSLLRPRHVTRGIREYINVMIGAPFTSVVQELHDKRDAAKELQSENAKKLGSLLVGLPTFKNNSDIQDGLSLLQQSMSAGSANNETLAALYELSSSLIPRTRAEIESQAVQSRKPSFLVRWWPALLTTLLYGPSTVASVITNRDLIVDFIQNNLIETVKGFWKNWILKPVTNILSTIRHDDNSEISIMSQKSLDSDLESLKRMVIEYTIETSPEYQNLSSTDALFLKQQLEEMVATGDLTSMMKGYEQDIKKPLKNIVSGRLPRALLIQLQKTKVDGAVAISGIDKLLKSQELVFGIVAASPSLLIVMYVLRALNAYIQKGYITRGTGENKILASRNLNNVERLLSRLEDAPQDELDYINGMLLLESISLRNAGLFLVAANRRSDWIRDVNDLVDSKATNRSRLNTVSRIYHVYGQFLA